jgi:hypothetical protein
LFSDQAINFWTLQAYKRRVDVNVKEYHVEKPYSTQASEKAREKAQRASSNRPHAARDLPQPPHRI